MKSNIIMKFVNWHTLGTRKFTVANARKEDAKTLQCELYGGQRWGMNFLNVPDGKYILESGHCEAYRPQPNVRVFSLLVNGKYVREKIDLAREAGFQKAFYHRVPVEPVNGQIEFILESIAGNASISLIRLLAENGKTVFQFRCDRLDRAALNAGKKTILHLIGNAHLDPVWMWTWQEGFAEVIATTTSALERMKETPDFKFVCSSAAHYEWIFLRRPDLYKQIKQRVKEGRWEVVGGWWVQPDCNLPGGESFVRHGLYAQRFFRETLGKQATSGYCVDSFGHNYQIPQFLKKAGMENYVHGRPSHNEKKMPGNNYIWQGLDGSAVQGLRLAQGYGSPDGPMHFRVCQQLQFRDEKFKNVDVFYGVGDHGGGPTKRQIKSALEIGSRKETPTVVFSTVQKYFQAIRKEGFSLPVVKDDLQYFARGCYTSNSEIKRLNRNVETELVEAEILSSLAREVAGTPYPAEQLSRSWKDLLFNQFHDILAGTSTKTAYDDARDQLGHSRWIARTIINTAFKSLARQVDTRGGNYNFLVFNPLPWSRKTIMRMTTNFIGPHTFKLVDSTGRSIPFHRKEEEGIVVFHFLAELPAMGFTTYHIKPGKPAMVENKLQRKGDTEIISGKWKIGIHPTAGIVSLVDRKTGVEFLSGPAAELIALADFSDPWAMGCDEWREEKGRFSNAKLEFREDVPGGIRIIRNSFFGSSRISQEFLIHPELDVLPLKFNIFWGEPQSMLKAAFPLNLTEVRVTAEIPYGNIRRPNDGTEQPMQSWVDVTGQTGDKTIGLSVLNDSKYAFDVLDNELRITMLRCIPYVCSQGEFLDLGQQTVNLALLPHHGDWCQADTWRRAMELNYPPTVVWETEHKGVLSPQKSFAGIEGSGVQWSVLKRHEDGKGYIIRVVERHGRKAKARLNLEFLKGGFETELMPYEIKTILIRGYGKSLNWEEVDFLEYTR